MRRRHGARIHELGPVEPSEHTWPLAHAGLVVVPSVVEDFGLVPFEAAAVGTPCHTMAGAALAEILSIDPHRAHRDPERTADEIWPLLTDPACRAAAVDHMRRAATRHTWAIAAAATWELLDRVLGLARR